MNGAISDAHEAQSFAKGVDFGHASIAMLQSRLNDSLAAAVPTEDEAAGELLHSIRHSLLAPGKRARGIIVLLACEAFGGDPETAVAPACAVELLHTASLIVDDLPAMDNARLRRGRESNHLRFGEDTAILASITMLSEVFGIIARAPGLPDECRVDVVAELSGVVGLHGLAVGQHLDLRASRGERSVEDVERIHRLKTGTLFAVSAWLGARIAGARTDALGVMRDFGMDLGLAFQTYDDLADRHASVASSGKDVLADDRKATLVALHGSAAATMIADRHFAAAVGSLGRSGARGGRLTAFVSELRDLLKSRMVHAGAPSPAPPSTES